MGTRSLTCFIDEEGKEFLTIYKQWDGHPETFGVDIRDWLKKYTITNGIRDYESKDTANGMGCLAAQFIAHFKKGVGDIYIYPAGSRDGDEEFIYRISLTGDKATVSCSDADGNPVRIYRQPARKK